MARAPTPEGFDRWWPAILRLGGLFIALYETAIDKVDRPSLLVLAAGMMGLPWFIEAQKRLKNGGK